MLRQAASQGVVAPANDVPVRARQGPLPNPCRTGVRSVAGSLLPVGEAHLPSRAGATCQALRSLSLIGPCDLRVGQQEDIPGQPPRLHDCCFPLGALGLGKGWKTGWLIVSLAAEGTFYLLRPALHLLVAGGWRLPTAGPIVLQDPHTSPTSTPPTPHPHAWNMRPMSLPR